MKPREQSLSGLSLYPEVMIMNVLLVVPMEPPRRVEIENSLESMQAVVGGPIQAVYPFDEPVALVCNA